MRGRQANLLLLVVVPLSAATGFLMFVLGSGPVWPVAILHGVVALLVVVLVPWKSMVVRRALHRSMGPRHERRAGVCTSALLGFTVVLALLTGVVHVVGLLFDEAPLTTMQLHVGGGVLAVVLTVAHARQRRVRPRRADLSRRSFVRLAGLASVATVLTAGVQASGALKARRGIRRATGSFQLTDSAVAAIPATSWFFDQAPELEPSSWRLTVTTGGSSRDWSLAELDQWRDRQVAVLDCTGGWWTEQEWVGVRLSRLLPPGSTGTVEVTSATGYSRRLPLTDQLLLATAVGGTGIFRAHGAPARLVVPGRRGYHWVKWVVRISHDERPWWVQPPLPLR
ncbi:Oxidoreductase molybdopterin binding domain-containing protein [Pedococcus dokdonensis]|uniref:Oxidoreductase molybdopterin binding domain-containing protein n=1 Tax=Pedococcus dokdonensis TaxID=443156 RepID=A0A1H0PG07_9MICO|nr:molybdopterin-dependent oxidoreductase [Pedococcus dokdonensis]SDP03585.1 Oxidoreductase molybdopterin binding domain-containing protein [Pedococcus dokdonensis]